MVFVFFMVFEIESILFGIHSCFMGGIVSLGKRVDGCNDFIVFLFPFQDMSNCGVGLL